MSSSSSILELGAFSSCVWSLALLTRCGSYMMDGRESCAACALQDATARHVTYDRPVDVGKNRHVVTSLRKVNLHHVITAHLVCHPPVLESGPDRPIPPKAAMSDGIDPCLDTMRGHPFERQSTRQLESCHAPPYLPSINFSLFFLIPSLPL